MKTLSKIAIGIAAVAALYSCSAGDKKTATSEATVNVEVYSPAEATSQGIYISGEIVAKQTATISTRMMGYVNKIYVKPGDKVAAGELLVAISSDEIVAKKAQAQAMITEAEAAALNSKRDYDRFKTLHTQNSVSDKELENVALQNTSINAKLQMAKQQLNEVNAMLAYSNIKAPFSGIVTQKMMDEGSMANPGMPILTIEQNGELQVVASVSESYIQYVNVGDKAKIEIKSQAISIDGLVKELSPSASRTGGLYAMKLSIDTEGKENIHAGMFVNVFIPGNVKMDNLATIMLDTSSIIYREQLTGVYAVNDKNEAYLRWVRLGKTVGNQVEVLSGLSLNEQVVLKADGKLFNGVKVSVSK